MIVRHYQSENWVRVTTEGPLIAEVGAVDGPSEVHEDDHWIAPAFWDIQLNGRWGISFSDPTLTVDQVVKVVRAQAGMGTARLCPTLITASRESTSHGLRTIAAACDLFPDVAKAVVGVHLEGPYISSEDGYRGAHPIDAVRDPDWDQFQTWQGESGGRVHLMTLAPERPGAIEFIRQAVAEGVVIALGHTAADGPTLRAAVDAGARLSTHLGNGIAAQLPRHPNPIWQQAADDRLAASLIADGHHLDPDVLRVLVRAKTPGRIILVSDASPLAGLPPGRHGPWAVDPSGKIVVAGTPYLAGSNQGLDVGLSTLMSVTGLPLDQALDTVTTHPAHLLGHPGPNLAVGQAANLVRFQIARDEDSVQIRLRAACVDGVWTDCPSVD
ncbi:MAG: amidohydrolase family protein [Isosphaeraceae bacterium]